MKRYVSEWIDMSIRGLAYHWSTTIKYLTKQHITYSIRDIVENSIWFKSYIIYDTFHWHVAQLCITLCLLHTFGYLWFFRFCNRTDWQKFKAIFSSKFSKTYIIFDMRRIYIVLTFHSKVDLYYIWMFQF